MKKIIFTLLLFQLSTFNFQLSTAFAQDLYVGSLYVTSTEEESLLGDGKNTWANRRAPICDILNFEQPDVLGLQSLNSTQLSFIANRLTNYTASGDIFYNKNNLELLSNGTVSDMPDGSTCSWVKLRKEEKDFYVFNICFSTTATVASTSSTRVITAIGEINTENLPCIIVGFLGVNETKTPYSRLSVKYNDCYTKAPVVSAELGTVNNFDIENNHGTERFDFVFASKTVTIKAYGQLQYGYFTKESDGTYKRRQLSSHFPIMAKLTLP